MSRARDRLSGTFWLYWTSTTASYLGDGIRFVAVPLLAASLTSSPAEVAAVAVAAGLPWPLFSLAAGVVVDRLDRRQVLVVTQVVRAVVGVAFTLFVLQGVSSIPLLIAFVFLLTSCEVFYDLALHSVLPSIVAVKDLDRANSKLIVAETVVFEFVGPAIGGLLFAMAGALAFGADALTFGLSAVLLVSIAHKLGQQQDHRRERMSIRTELHEGLSWFWTQRLVRILTLIAAAINFGSGGLFALLVLFAREALLMGPAQYGLMLSIAAGGSVIGGLLVSRLQKAALRRIICAATAPATGSLMIVMIMFPTTIVAVGCLILAGLLVTILNVIAISLRQALTPQELLGRVTSVHRLICWGTLPLGAGFSGVIAQFFGIGTAIAITGILVIVVAVALIPALLKVPTHEFGLRAQEPDLTEVD